MGSDLAEVGAKMARRRAFYAGVLAIMQIQTYPRPGSDMTTSEAEMAACLKAVSARLEQFTAEMAK